MEGDADAEMAQPTLKRPLAIAKPGSCCAS
jgi:hypothetical protein